MKTVTTVNMLIKCQFSIYYMLLFMKYNPLSIEYGGVEDLLTLDDSVFLVCFQKVLFVSIFLHSGSSLILYIYGGSF